MKKNQMKLNKIQNYDYWTLKLNRWCQSRLDRAADTGMKDLMKSPKMQQRERKNGK